MIVKYILTFLKALSNNSSKGKLDEMLCFKLKRSIDRLTIKKSFDIIEPIWKLKK